MKKFLLALTSVTLSCMSAFALNGTYTINSGGGANYSSYTAAISALIAGGAQGPVTFNVTGGGPYNEQLTIPAITGASAVNKITFNGNGTTLTYAPTGSPHQAVILLDGADYITLNNMMIISTGSTYGVCVRFHNNANFNTVSNCTLDAGVNTTGTNNSPVQGTASNTAYSTSGNHGNDNIVINNTMIGGYWAIAWYNAVSNAATQNQRNSFIGNTIRDFYVYGFYNPYAGDGWVFSGNSFYRQFRTSITTFYAMYCYSYPSQNLGASGWIVEKNRVHTPQGPTTTTPTCIGIYWYYFMPASGTAPNICRNNAVYNFGGSGASTFYGIYSIYSQVEIYHNTIDFTLTNSTKYGMFVYSGFNAAIPTIIRNNIIRMAAPGGSNYNYYIYNYNSNLQINYNDVVNSSSAGVYYAYYINTGTTYTTFASFQSGTGFDAQGVSIQPTFNNPAAGDFRPTNSSLNNLGTPVGVTDDILGDPRNPTTPDMGAWEFSSAPDFGVLNVLQPSSGCVPSATATVQVQVRNFSTTAGAPTSITFQVTGPNNTGPITEAWAGGSIPGLTSMNQTFSATANLSTPGTYTVTANTTLAGDTDPSNNTKTKVITITTPVVASAGVDVTVCPGGPKVIGGSPTGNGGNGVYTYLWAPATGLSGTTVSNPSAGPGLTTTYTVTVTDGNGCTSNDQVLVTWSPAPVINAGPDWEYCENSGTIVPLGGSPSATGGAPPYSFTWMPNQDLTPNNTDPNPMANPNLTTTYTMTVVDAVGCTLNDAATVTVNMLPVVTLQINAGRDSMCFGESVTLEAMVGTCTNWSGFSGPQYDCPEMTFENIPSGVGGSWDCSTAPASIKITGGNSGVGGGSVVWLKEIPCDGFVSFNWSFTTNDGPYWDPWGYRLNGTFFALTNPNGATSQSGSASIAVTTGDVFGFSQNTLDGIVAPGITTISNFSAPAYLVPAAYYGYGVLWSTGETTGIITNTPPVTTTITADVTDLDGCVGVGTIDLWVNQPIVLSTPDVSMCQGFNVMLGGAPTAAGGSGGFVYLWDPITDLSCFTCPNPISNTGFSRTHTLTVTDAFNCVVGEDVVITVNPNPEADAGPPQAVCPGNSTMIGGSPTGFNGTGPYTYSWSPAAGLDNATLANPTATPAATTGYTVTVTDANGCVATDQMTVIVYSSPDASILTTGPYCENSGVVILQAASPGGTWSGTGIVNPATGAFDPALAGPGVHMITYDVTNAVGCSDSDTEPITVNNLTAVSITSPTDYCNNGGTVFLTATPSGGTWSGNGIVGPTTGQFEPSVAGTGAHAITYTYTDGNGCTNTDVATIDVHAAPDATINAAGPFCENAGIQQLTSASPGGTWSGPGTNAAGQFNPAAAGVGSHTVTNTVTDANGCSDTDTEVITVLSAPTASINASGPYCANGTPVTLTASPAQGTNYWSGPGIVNPLTGTFSPSSAGAGVHMITVTKTYANGCTSTGTINVTVNGLPDATINPVNLTNTLCAGGANVQLTSVTPGGTWSGPGTSPSGLFNPTVAGSGIHTVTHSVTDANGCSNSDDMQITVAPAIVVTGVVTDPLCDQGADGSIDVTVYGGTPPLQYMWDDATITQDRDKLGTGTYDLTVTDAGGCTGTGSFTVDDPTPITITPITTTDALTPSFDNGTITISPAGGTPPYTFQWSNGSTEQNPTGLQADTYHVTVMDSHGCRFELDIPVGYTFDVGITSSDIEKALTLYPNPTDGVINFELKLGVTADVSLRLVDVLGRTMYAEQGTMVNTYTNTIDMSTWASGQYILMIQVDDQMVQTKVVLTK